MSVLFKSSYRVINVVRSALFYGPHIQQKSFYAWKVPKSPAWTESPRKAEIPEISEELARYLERTSLVEFTSDDGIKQLHQAIEFADQIQHVDTDGVEPLFSLNEDEVAYLREDEVTEGDCREELISQAVKSVEDWYFVTPPGNVPLDQSKNDSTEEKGS